MASASFHRRWLGALESVGLVVSPTALDNAGLVVDSNIQGVQTQLASCLTPDADGHATLTDFEGFARTLFGWRDSLFAGSSEGPSVPSSLVRTLPEFAGDSLAPDYAFLLPESRRTSYEASAAKYPVADAELLVMVLQPGTPFDKPQGEDDGRRWWASPQQRLERLMRETGVVAGLLCNGSQLRLVSAPVGESSGSLTWPVRAFDRVDGRELLAALRMLLQESTIVGSKADRRLTAVLRDSRLYQNEVSTRLARQVKTALDELVAGWQAATERDQRVELTRIDDRTLYEGLLAVLLRLVFMLYAEERGMMPNSELFVRYYSVLGLFERLREDFSKHPDTLDQRFGAWARLCVLFRLIHDGSTRAELAMPPMPPRQGRLFDPDSWPFLEGRLTARQLGETLDLPRVSDGVVYRVLDDLLMLKDSSGLRERLSYRALDVEHLGSVYEGMTGYGLQRLTEVSARHGDTILGVESLLAAKPADRSKKLKDAWGKTPPASVAKAAAEAKDVESFFELTARSGLQRLNRRDLTVVATHGRRSSGSHYTPRALTGPIVREALRPHFDNLPAVPTPGQILALKVCDPAMGSGAFLVETVRQLGERLEASWLVHGVPPEVVGEVDRAVAARRVVAQRCVYGIDLNAFAVDLAKLSLWLVTLSREHAFTFVDHALRHGDSLVGLGRDEIVDAISGAKGAQPGLTTSELGKRLRRALQLRAELSEKPFDDNTAARRRILRDAMDELDEFELVGDALVAERFAKVAGEKFYASGSADLGRRLISDNDVAARGELMDRAAWLRILPRPVPPLHWDLVFPEVFSRENGGFDVIVGNPPFLGGTMISTHNGAEYLMWLGSLHGAGLSRTDLVAHFFRRSFSMLRQRGCLGLIATNTIAQGDTRTHGLAWIRQKGGAIYRAFRSQVWPGAAAVHVSIVHVCRAPQSPLQSVLDGIGVEVITGLLMPAGPDDNPAALSANEELSFEGVKIYGQGFTFEQDPKGTLANPIELADSLIAEDPRNSTRIRPYLGGEEINSHPEQAASRLVIDFEQFSLEKASEWPAILAVVRERVKPERERIGDKGGLALWWQHFRPRQELRARMRSKSRVLAISQVTTHVNFAWMATTLIPSHALNIVVLDYDAAFATLNSRIHVLWALTFQSSMEDRSRYTPSTCFENFPFPSSYESNAALNDVGERFNSLRAHIMKTRWEGLTKTYNRFHDPAERSDDIAQLRALHAEMDQGVLDAYDWGDLQPVADFYTDEGRRHTELDDDERAELRKRDVRLRWSPEMEAEVLARLLKLHAERYAEEVKQGLHSKKAKPAKAKADAADDDGKPKKSAENVAKSSKGASKPKKAKSDAADADADSKQVKLI
jgi:hypothetical protein